MKFSISAALVLLLSSTTTTTSHAQVIFDDMPALALGVGVPTVTPGSAKAEEEEGGLKGKSKSGKECDPSKVVLADYPQWQAEIGYWIGEYSFYGSDGKPYTSTWPYKYDAYKGFITGNVEGNAYRQRNVFLYPPGSSETCGSADPNVVGDGTCGENGNSLVFFADQEATTCSRNPELAGDVNGPFISPFGDLPTFTSLVGADNALLYQVYFPPYANPIQSQLTTLTKGIGSDEFNIRTRTAQGLNFVTGGQDYASFYRERKVSKEDFYTELQSAITEYNILDSDLCHLDGGNGRNPVDGYTAGYEQCVEHLETSFDL